MTIKRIHNLASAYANGYKGIPKKNPYPIGSGPWFKYEEHYDEGKADRRAGK